MRIKVQIFFCFLSFFLLKRGSFYRELKLKYKRMYWKKAAKKGHKQGGTNE